MKKQFTELIGVCFTAILLLIGSTGAQAQYCESVGGNAGDDWLSGVEFAGIDNPSGPATYTDFTDILGTVVPGVSYEFTGTIGNSGTWVQFITVFIDFNQDELFDNVTERFDLGSCASDGCTITGDILIPIDAIPGTTRMRVIENWNGEVLDACQSNTFMETEDYSLLIGGDCAPPTIAFAIDDSCAVFTYNVTASLVDAGSDGLAGTITVFLTRSDIGDAGFVTYPGFLFNPASPGYPLTVPVISDVPFGVTVTASIEASDPVCNSGRTWNEIGLCPPENNECDLATELVCGETIDGSTINGSFAPEGTDFCNGFVSLSAPTVWYAYTSPVNALLTASIAVSFDAQHFVYSGSCDALQCIDGSDFGPISWNAEAGETFYVMVTGWGTGVGDFSITLDCEEITCDFPAVTAMMVDDNGDEITDCLPVGASYRVAIDLSGGEGNDSFTVVVGDSTKVMVSPEIHIFGTYNAGVNTNVTVDGDQNPLCNDALTVVSELCAPTNDDCASAQAIACGETLAGTNLGATPVSPEFAWCNTFVSQNTGAVWYSITPETNAFVTVGVDVQFDAQHQVFSGSCDGLVCIDGSDFGDITFAASADETYYVVVSGWGTSQGLFDITVTCEEITCLFPEVTAVAVDDEGVAIDGCLDFGLTHRVQIDLANGEGNDSYTVSVGDSTLVMVSGDTHIFGTYDVGSNVNVSVVGDLNTDCNVNTSVIVPICPALNDLCADAFEAICGQSYGGTTLGATAAAGQEYCGTTSPNVANGGVWYEFTVAGTTDIEISLEGSGYDTKLFLYSGTCDALTCVDGNDDFFGLQSFLATSVDAGTYYIYVSGFNTARGTYNMSLSCIDVACSPVLTATAVADAEGTELTDCVDQTGEYYVSVAVSGGANNDFYNINVNGFALGQVPADGSVVVGPIAATSVANVSVTGADQITCSATATASVVICPPSNDFPCEAIPITTDGVGGVYTNVNATADAGEPNPIFGDGQSVWFTFVGPASGRVNVSLCGENTNFDTGLGVYEVELCGDYTTYTEVASNDDNFAACGPGNKSELETCVTPGVTYYVSVVGFGSNSGTFDIAATEVDGAVCLCDLPDFGPEVFTFADTAPVCIPGEDPGFSLTFYSWTDMGSSTGFVYTYAWDGNGPFTVVLLEGEAPVTVPETFPLGTVIAVTVDIDDPNCTGADGSIYPLSGNVVQDEFACDEDCEGTPGGTVGPGSPCLTVDDAPGSYNIDCECIPAPANDTCENAIALECDAPAVVGTNVSASSSLMCNGAERNSVWYTFTSDVAATVFMTTCNPETNFDTDISMFTGSCEDDDLVCFPGWGGGGYIDGNSGCTFQAWASEGTFEAEAGVTYYIAVAGFAGFEGDFGITLTCEIDDAVSVNGTIDNWPVLCTESPVTIDLYNVDALAGELPISSFTGVVDANGDFLIEGLPTGTYDAIIKADRTLAIGFADFVIVAGSNAVALGNVTNGDATGDNQINIFDVSLVNNAFNTEEGEAGYNPLADLNCTLGVNIFDISIVTSSFGFNGAETPLD